MVFIGTPVVYNGKATNIFMRRPDGMYNTYAFPYDWHRRYTLLKNYRGLALRASNQQQIDEHIRLRKMARTAQNCRLIDMHCRRVPEPIYIE